MSLGRAKAAQGGDTGGYLQRDRVTYRVSLSDSGSETDVKRPLPKVYWVGGQGGTAGLRQQVRTRDFRLRAEQRGPGRAVGRGGPAAPRRPLSRPLT